MDNTLLQIPTILYAAYGGVLMGIFYDALRIIRFGKISQLLCDAAFWVFCLLLAFTMLTQTTVMRFRLFVVAGYILGYCVYYWSLGFFLRIGIAKFRDIVKMLLNKFLQLLA